MNVIMKIINNNVKTKICTNIIAYVQVKVLSFKVLSKSCVGVIKTQDGQLKLERPISLIFSNFEKIFL